MTVSMTSLFGVAAENIDEVLKNVIVIGFTSQGALVVAGWAENKIWRSQAGIRRA
jgi:hypothetical protein